MKSYPLTILFCFAFFHVVFSQDYIPMLQGNAEWEERIVDFGGDVDCSGFSLDGPQMLDTLTGYKIAGNQTHDEVWLFEDESLRQVFYFRENSDMTSPKLLYDFSLEVGDTTQVVAGDTFFNPNSEVTLEVTEIDYYDSPIGSHKMLYLSELSGPYSPKIWIESIGATTEGGFFATLAPTDPYIRINKVWKSGELIYNTGEACMPVIDCTTPPDPIEGDITQTTAYVTWGGGAETTYVYYQVQWRMVGEENWQIASSGFYSEYTILDLQPNTLYEWQVRKVCGGQGTTAYTMPRQFMTQPVNIIPIEQSNIALWYQNNTIHIERPNEQRADFFVYDINGKLLYTKNIGQNTSINIDLPYGVYVVFLRENSDEQYSGKFLVTD